MERLANRTLEATIDPCDLTVAVRDLRTGIVWRMQTAGPGDIGIKGHGGPWQGLPFSAAGSVVWEGNASRRTAVLSKWPYRPNVWSPMDFVVEVAF